MGGCFTLLIQDGFFCVYDIDGNVVLRKELFNILSFFRINNYTFYLVDSGAFPYELICILKSSGFSAENVGEKNTYSCEFSKDRRLQRFTIYFTKRKKTTILNAEKICKRKGEDIDFYSKELLSFIVSTCSRPPETMAKIAYNEFVKTIGGYEKFRDIFPKCGEKVNRFIRNAYDIGFLWINKAYKGVVLDKGVKVDVNSLFPYIMKNFYLPFGEGCYFSGEYLKDNLYNRYIQRLSVCCKLKENCIPCIRTKGIDGVWASFWLEDTQDQYIEITICDCELNGLFDNYYVFGIDFIDGYKFRSSKKLFSEYIDRMYFMKKKSKEDGNKIKYRLYKNMMNFLCGNFARNTQFTKLVPFIDEDGVVQLKEKILKGIDPVFTPVPAFVNAYSRMFMHSIVKDHYDKIAYCGIDSIHIVGNDISFIDVGEDIGQFKIDGIFDRAIYFSENKYVTEKDKKINPVFSGLNSSEYNDMDLDSFLNSEIKTKRLKRVKGGAKYVYEKYSIM